MAAHPPAGGFAAANAQHFDTEAAHWEQSRPYLRDWAAGVFAAYRRTAAEALTPDARVLECGCGTGLLSELLVPHVAEVVGADISPNMVAAYNEKAAARGLRTMRAVCLDVTDEAAVGAARAAGQLPAEGFDAVCMHMTLHHVDDAGAMLRALAGLLRPGGRLLLSDITHGPGTEAFHPPRNRHTVAYPGGFAEAQLRGWFEAAGLAWLAWDAQAVLAPRQVEHEDGSTSSMDFHLFFAVGQRAQK